MESLRILVPVGLFLAFAGAHYVGTQSKLETMELTAAGRDLKAGTQLVEASLDPVSIQGTASLFRNFVPFGQRGQDLLYAPLNRDVKKGELIALSDLLQPVESQLQLEPDEVGVHVSLEKLSFEEGQITVGVQVGFLLETMKGEQAGKMELLEPFRVIGIGDRVIAAKGMPQDEKPRNPKLLTIAVKRTAEGGLEEKALRLMGAAADDLSDRPERVRALVMLGG